MRTLESVWKSFNGLITLYSNCYQMSVWLCAKFEESLLFSNVFSYQEAHNNYYYPHSVGSVLLSAVCNIISIRDRTQ